MHNTESMAEEIPLKTEDIRGFVKDSLDLSMRDLYAIIEDRTVLNEPKYEKAINILGEMSLREKVETEAKPGRPTDKSYFPSMLQRLENGQLGEGEYDMSHLKSFAEREARRIWYLYLKNVYKDKYGVSFTVGFSNEPITETDLFPRE